MITFEAWWWRLSNRSTVRDRHKLSDIMHLMDLVSKHSTTHTKRLGTKRNLTEYKPANLMQETNNTHTYVEHLMQPNVLPMISALINFCPNSHNVFLASKEMHWTTVPDSDPIA
jgi:hypothetical protein